MVRLWNRLMTMDQSRLTKRIFLWETNKCNNWVSDIKLLNAFLKMYIVIMKFVTQKEYYKFYVKIIEIFG